MTIESRELFELCKQVHEATGWENTKDGFFDGGEVMPFTDRIGAYIGASNFRCPLYTSDYLLEKLPATIKNTDNNGDFNRPKEIALQLRKWDRSVNGGMVFFAEYHELYHIPLLRTEAGTPLKALLKLTLKLHEEGIL